MFKGEFEYVLDDKNRVVLPASLRKDVSDEKLTEGFILVIGRKAQCLEIHPKRDWMQRIERQHDLYSDDDEEAEEYFRDIISSAFDVELDKNYRFVIPEARKKEARVGKEVVFIGVWKRIEIWDKERWLERKNARAGKQSPPKADREN
jgi:MraZ protein